MQELEARRGAARVRRARRVRAPPRAESRGLFAIQGGGQSYDTMSSNKDSMWRWWSKFDQVQQLSDIMSVGLIVLIDDYLTAHPCSDGQKRGGQERIVGFDEYIMHRAVTEVSLCPTPSLPCFLFRKK